MKRCMRMDSLFADVMPQDVNDLTKLQKHNLMTFMYMICDYFGENLPPSFEKIRDEIIEENFQKMKKIEG